VSRQLLRAPVLAAGGAMLAAAAAGALACWRSATIFTFAAWGAILIGGVLIERWRYWPLTADRPGPDWQATAERFVDPESGRRVTVFFNPATGERRYVADAEPRLTAAS
jgi:hypothetical protein